MTNKRSLPTGAIFDIFPQITSGIHTAPTILKMFTKDLILTKTFIIIVAIYLTQFFSNNCFAVEPDEILQNQKQELRARDISKNIRCMICQNQSIDE